MSITTDTPIVAQALRDDAELIKSVRPDIANRMRIAAALLEQLQQALKDAQVTMP